MEPTRDTHATLVDLLDRILDKGLVLNADIIISVAGIPLIGVNLRAAIAGMETMLKYGVMQAWDTQTRAWESEHRKKYLPALIKDEDIALKMFGSYYYNKGIYNAWKPGFFYLTGKRLILYRQDFDEIIFQIPLEEIKALAIKEEAYFTKEKKKVICLIGSKKAVHRFSAAQAEILKDAIVQNIEARGFSLEKISDVSKLSDLQITTLLMDNESVLNWGEKIWYLMPSDGIAQDTWRSGHLFLTDKRLIWWYDFEKRIIFDVYTNKVISINIETRKTSGLSNCKEKVLDVIYQSDNVKKAVSFAGGEIEEWIGPLNEIVNNLADLDPETEVCPKCGKEAPAKELLEKGCSNCNWVSPMLGNKTKIIDAKV